MVVLVVKKIKEEKRERKDVLANWWKGRGGDVEMQFECLWKSRTWHTMTPWEDIAIFG